MKTLSRFVTKFTSLIVAVLSCFDRVIFKGHLPSPTDRPSKGSSTTSSRSDATTSWTSLEQQSETLVDHAKRPAQEAGAEYRFLQGVHRKDKLVDEILRQRPILEGLICVLCCMECCASFKLISGKDRPRLINARRPQRVLSFYLPRSQAGPDPHPVARPGSRSPSRSTSTATPGLAQQLLQRRLGFTQQDNAFTALDDPKAAQKLADSFVRQNGPKILNRLVRQVNPLMNEPWFRSLRSYTESS